jgi:ribosomal-protein-alanine N-acetyltransferase
MCEEHITALTAIEQACFTTPWTNAGLTAELQNPHAHFLIALYQGEVAGYVGLHYHESEAAIANIAASPNLRRKGIATAVPMAIYTSP